MAGLADRVEIVAGDYFEIAPKADVYMLSAVLQDCDNAAALRNVAKAAPTGARLVAIDMVVPEGDVPHATKMIDITMLGMLSGRQRSESEFRGLLADGGFTLHRAVSGSGACTALEATLARMNLAGIWQWHSGARD